MVHASHRKLCNAGDKGGCIEVEAKQAVKWFTTRRGWFLSISCLIKAKVYFHRFVEASCVKCVTVTQSRISFQGDF